jgi:signal transduction histidine kinase
MTAESLERNRAEAIRQRVDDERIRMAQEVHDIVGHGVAAIKMQADVALHVLARQPEQAEAALRAISNTSAQALDELRATLAVVRRPAAEAERTPTPGLGQLRDLCDRMSDSGVSVRLETTGMPRPVPDRVGLVAYRVVQEALTNVLKHSDATAALVRVRYVTGHLVLLIDNPGGGADPPGEGLGIAGMRSRVEDLGGTFTAGPTAAGRFRVRAALPTGESGEDPRA